MAWTELTRTQHKRKTKRYPSDLTAEEWTVVRPLLPARNRLGRPRHVKLRRVWNGSRSASQASLAALRRRSVGGVTPVSNQSMPGAVLAGATGPALLEARAASTSLRRARTATPLSLAIAKLVVCAIR
jgi:hypothetical protein